MNALIDDFNLLVSSARGSEREANSELWYLIGELGDRSVKTDYTPVSGLTVATTRMDPVRVVEELRSILRERPWEFRYVLKVKPVRRVVPCEVERIAEAAAEQSDEIGMNETFRVSLEKRQNEIASKAIIEAVAARIQRKVDLRNPKKIVLIEIIGKLAGVSVIKPDQVLGIEKEKREAIPPKRGAQTSQSPAA